ncbi:MAG: tetratricopeptide repeat protein [Cyclobacteriaceae bacterium]|nr:tetratricopeptide repeat protein [Cyclobacteriaceae bacterium]
MEFTEGDIFYTRIENKYHLHKVLKVDRDFGTYHVLGYSPAEHLPDPEKVEALTVFIHHFPIDKNGFENPVLFKKSRVRDEELIGYHEYLRQTQNMDSIIEEATRYFHEGYALTDQKKHEEAIEKYTRAFDLFPTLYEALDNRAFCKMDLGRWKDAIDDFKLSLTIHPYSALAEFSIGECYLKLGDLHSAKQYFNRALAVDPDHQLSKDFLQRLEESSKPKR